MSQIVLAGIIAIVGGIVGCAVYIPKTIRDYEESDFRQAIVDAIPSVLSILILILGICMVPYY